MTEEIKIQTEPAPDAGAQTPLSPNAAAGRVRGTDQDQNTMSFSRGTEVAASSQDSARGYSVTGVSVSVTPTDRRTIEGSTPGDFRAKPGDTANASLTAVSGSNKPPRDPVQQAPLSRTAITSPWPTGASKQSDNIGG